MLVLYMEYVRDVACRRYARGVRWWLMIIEKGVYLVLKEHEYVRDVCLAFC